MTRPEDYVYPIAGTCGEHWQPGMSLLDYFAAAALPQAVEDYGEPSGSGRNRQRTDHGNPVLPYSAKAVGAREEIIARQAYRYAKAMMRARAELAESQ